MNSSLSHPELYACIYVREFPAQALLRLRPELRNQPCVVMCDEPPLEQVCSLNARARALGVTNGMTRVEIDTFPSLTSLSRSFAEESSARDTLLECAGTFSPRVEALHESSSFLCVIDIAGTEKLYGPPAILAATLQRRVKSFGFTTSIAICSNFHASICLARGMYKRQITIVAPGDEPTALASLPIVVLNLSQQHLHTLHLWGIHTLGMLAALEEKALISRLGQPGKQLQQLARGELPHLFQPVEPAFHLEERMDLDTPIELLDSLLFVIGLMLEQLILRASARIFALASVTITLSLDGNSLHTLTIRPALPNNDRITWLKLLHLDLDAHPPGKPILALTLTAEPSNTSKVQLGLFSPQLPEPMRLDVTLARIRSIVGDDCVGQPVLKDKHQPDSFRIEQFQLLPGIVNDAPETHTRTAIRQLRPPETVSVTVSARRPTSFFFRQKRFLVEQAYGPWLAGGDWWNSSQWNNEQWDIVSRSEGPILCCCLVRNHTEQCWQIVAIYD